MSEDKFLRARGVHSGNKCKQCHGVGVRTYASTATWRGGMGGCAMTTDVCDLCWGSGRTDKVWANLRQLEKQARDRVDFAGFDWLSKKLGCTWPQLRILMGHLSEFCDKQARKRKIPDGFDAFSWHRNWESLARILAQLKEATPQSNAIRPGKAND